MKSPVPAVKKFFIGVLVGIASTVPGVSGAVLAVCFGIYERLISDIADIAHKIREDFGFLMVVGVGIAFGIVVSFKGLDWILEHYLVASMMLFTGMILGQLPELWKHTERESKPSKTNVLAFAVGIVITLLFLAMAMMEAEEIKLSHDAVSCLCMVLIGMIFSVSHLVPGISGATILLAMGLYPQLIETIASFDVVLMVPLVIGVFIGLIGFSKVVSYALTRYRRSTYLMIFGLTIGSVFVILYEAAAAGPGVTDIALGTVALVGGIALSLLFSKLGKETSKEFSIR
ncbi:MAG: DUF368 domain-containing protein [Methanomassiliicoccaceae archaeon]|nr:DUF368 domain-containing protein [Methanomassiliicoccaceae archaeon]